MSFLTNAGAVIFAKDLQQLSLFYQSVLTMRLLEAGPAHHVIAGAGMQLVIHAIPAPIAATIELASPPVPREEQAIKLLFTVQSLELAQRQAVALGGGMLGQGYTAAQLSVRDGFDSEGNIFQLREVLR